MDASCAAPAGGGRSAHGASNGAWQSSAPRRRRAWSAWEASWTKGVGRRCRRLGVPLEPRGDRPAGLLPRAKHMGRAGTPHAVHHLHTHGSMCRRVGAIPRTGAEAAHPRHPVRGHRELAGMARETRVLRDPMVEGATDVCTTHEQAAHSRWLPVTAAFHRPLILRPPPRPHSVFATPVALVPPVPHTHPTSRRPHLSWTVQSRPPLTAELGLSPTLLVRPCCPLHPAHTVPRHAQSLCATSTGRPLRPSPPLGPRGPFRE